MSVWPIFNQKKVSVKISDTVSKVFKYLVFSFYSPYLKERVMNKRIVLGMLLSISSLSAMAIDWQNPPVMCPEEILPKGITCPDFSKVEKVYEDYPSEIGRAHV